MQRTYLKGCVSGLKKVPKNIRRNFLAPKINVELFFRLVAPSLVENKQLFKEIFVGFSLNPHYLTGRQDTKRNDTQHNDTQHKGPIYDIQHTPL